jgi:hypothetical protein
MSSWREGAAVLQGGLSGSDGAVGMQWRWAGDDDCRHREESAELGGSGSAVANMAL